MSVYFIRADGSELIKIGSAKNPFHRIRNLQIGSPAKLSLLAVIDADEKEMHVRFAHCRERGEWFRLNQEMAVLIDENPAIRQRKTSSHPIARAMMTRGLTQQQLIDLVNAAGPVRRNKKPLRLTQGHLSSVICETSRRAAGLSLTRAAGLSLTMAKVIAEVLAIDVATILLYERPRSAA